MDDTLNLIAQIRELFMTPKYQAQLRSEGEVGFVMDGEDMKTVTAHESFSLLTKEMEQQGILVEHRQINSRLADQPKGTETLRDYLIFVNAAA